MCYVGLNLKDGGHSHPAVGSYHARSLPGTGLGRAGATRFERDE